MRSLSGRIGVLAALVGALSENMGGAEGVPRNFIIDDPLAGHRYRPSTGGAFGGSRSYPAKGRRKPAGSKLARKAARGKL